MRLLAKSCPDPERPPDRALLAGHCRSVTAAVEALIALRAAPSLAALGLPPASLERLCRVVRLAAAVHDLGKCSDQFQAMLRGQRQVEQLVYHEAVSVLLASRHPLRGWLEGAVEEPVEWAMALSAVAGHHRRFPDRVFASAGSGAGTRLTCLTAERDFAALLDVIAARLGIGEVPALTGNVTFEQSSMAPIQDQIEDLTEDWGAMTQGSANHQENGLEPTVIFRGATKRPGAPKGRGGGGAPAVRGRASPPAKKGRPWLS